MLKALLCPYIYIYIYIHTYIHGHLRALTQFNKSGVLYIERLSICIYTLDTDIDIDIDLDIDIHIDIDRSIVYNTLYKAIYGARPERGGAFRTGFTEE